MNWSEIRADAPMLIAQFGFNLLAAVMILLVGQWLAKRVVAWTFRTAEQRGLDATVCGFLANIVYIGLLIMLAIAAIAQLGVPTTSFIAIVGAAGIAIGLALQGSLTNFASGVLLVFLKPCQVGDYIESGGYSGTVVRVHILNTTLRTPDNRTVIIPNTNLFNNPMINYSSLQTRRIDLVIAINHTADVAKAKQLLQSIIDADDRILTDPATLIGVADLTETAVNFTVRPWVQSSDLLAVKFDLNEKIKIALENAGIAAPYPKLAVQLQPDAMPHG